MKMSNVRIHNFRSISELDISVEEFMMFIGANNAGKSNVISAIRCFYDDLAWNDEDFPKFQTSDKDAWVQITFSLSEEEWQSLADVYKAKQQEVLLSRTLVLKRWLKGSKVKARQSNIYAVVDGKEDDSLFYGAKNVSSAKCGAVIYIPALTTTESQFKTAGTSPFKALLSHFMRKSAGFDKGLEVLRTAFSDFNEVARGEDGFLTQMQEPINRALKSWGISLDIRIAPIDANEIGKNLIHPAFVDGVVSKERQDIDHFGSGFQRTVIYELIKAASLLQDVKLDSGKKEFQPNLMLLLFEEPEAFLHPAQQEQMAINLRKVARQSDAQVFITSHSPIFVGKMMSEIYQICRLAKDRSSTVAYQLKSSVAPDYEDVGADFASRIDNFINDSTIPYDKKKKAREIKDHSPDVVDMAKFDAFRFQMWLDSLRSSMFFADKVLLVEGETERVLFNRLLMERWNDLQNERVFVLDALGKYNFVRYMRFFKAFGIKHGVIYDRDDSLVDELVINPYIDTEVNEFTLAKPVRLEKKLEDELEISIPGRDDIKPLQVLKYMDDGTFTEKKHFAKLRNIFCKALDLCATD